MVASTLNGVDTSCVNGKYQVRGGVVTKFYDGGVFRSTALTGSPGNGARFGRVGEKIRVRGRHADSGQRHRSGAETQVQGGDTSPGRTHRSAPTCYRSVTRLHETVTSCNKSNKQMLHGVC